MKHLKFLFMALCAVVTFSCTSDDTFPYKINLIRRALFMTKEPRALERLSLITYITSAPLLLTLAIFPDSANSEKPALLMWELLTIYLLSQVFILMVAGILMIALL